MHVFKFYDMKKTLTLILSLFLLSNIAYSQQDAMFTKYMFNSLTFNPAYAGSKDHMYVGLLHRTQWWGIEGAPSTQSFTLHTPLNYDRIGLGINIVNDAIGPTNSITANMSYAYRISIGDNGAKLSIGLQGGMMNWRADWNKITIKDQTDPTFEGENPSYWLPNFGVGLYYYSKYLYVGVSSPHLIEYDLTERSEMPLYAKQFRHYYFTAGGAIPLNGDDLIFKPSILIKNVGLFSAFKPEDSAFNNVGAPTEFDIDISFLFFEQFWIGSSFRSAIEVLDDQSSFDSVDLWMSYFMKNGLRIGVAYDYTLTKLQEPAQGSFEVMLGYEFNYQNSKIVTPRYF